MVLLLMVRCVTTTVTRLLISAVPKINGVVSLVTTGLVIVGAMGAVMSTTKFIIPGCEVLPNESVAVTETSYFPSASTAMGDRLPVGFTVAKFTDHAPLPLAVVV